MADNISGDLNSLLVKRNGILSNQEKNEKNQGVNSQNAVKNTQNTEKNVQNSAVAQKDSTAIAGQVQQKETERSGIAQEIETLRSDLSQVSSDDAETQRQIQEQIDAKDLSMKELDSDIEKLNAEKDAKDKEVKDLAGEKETLVKEKEGLDKEAGTLQGEAAELDTALKEVNEEIAVFKDVFENANGDADDVTPETVDKAFADLENKVLAKGAELKSEKKEGDQIVREYSDGTVIYYKKGADVTYSKPINNDYYASGNISTKEYLGNGSQSDEVSFFVSNNDGSNTKSGLYNYEKLVDESGGISHSEEYSSSYTVSGTNNNLFVKGQTVTKTSSNN